jgi:rubrerythrin
MTEIEALKLALAKEQASIDLYRDLVKKHSSLKELATFLIDEEFKHQKMIEEKLVELTRY